MKYRYMNLAVSPKGAQIKYDLSGGRDRTGRTEAQGRGGALGRSQQQNANGADVTVPGKSTPID